MRNVLAALLFLSFSVAVPATAALPSRAELMARRFLTNFTSNRFDEASHDFNEQMRAKVTPAVLARFKQQYDRDLGPFRSIASVRESTDGTFPVVELTAQFEKSAALVQVTFDTAGQIGALHFDRANDPRLEMTARQVLAAFNARRFEEIVKHLDERMTAQLPPASLESLYNDVTAVYGRLKSVTEVQFRTGRGFQVVSVFAECEKQPLLFEVTFDSRGRIAGWQFHPPR